MRRIRTKLAGLRSLAVKFADRSGVDCFMLSPENQTRSAGVKKERTGVSAISYAGLLITAIRERGGSGSKLSRTRKRGARIFSNLICQNPKVRLRKRRAFNHQAMTPGRLNSNMASKRKPALSTKSASCLRVYRR